MTTTWDSEFISTWADAYVQDHGAAPPLALARQAALDCAEVPWCGSAIRRHHMTTGGALALIGLTRDERRRLDVAVVDRVRFLCGIACKQAAVSLGSLASSAVYQRYEMHARDAADVHAAADAARAAAVSAAVSSVPEIASLVGACIECLTDPRAGCACA